MNPEAGAPWDDEYGGLIEVVYKQYSEEEIPEKIKNLKDRIDKLFSIGFTFQLAEKLESFSEEERNYLNCKILDDFFKIYNKNDPLEEAIKIGVSKKIIDLCLKYVFYNYDKYFILSVNYGRIYIVEKLLPKVSKEAKDRSLIIASEKNYIDIVNILLNEPEIDIRFENDKALLVASQNGHLDVVKLLTVRYPPSIGKMDNIEHALILASRNGHFEIVKFLLEKGVNIHAKNDYAINEASEYGHLEVVKLLLEKGADPNANFGSSLRYAVKYNKNIIVRTLVEHGATVTTETVISALKEQNIDIAKYLITFL